MMLVVVLFWRYFCLFSHSSVMMQGQLQEQDDLIEVNEKNEILLLFSFKDQKTNLVLMYLSHWK